jgi:signal peptidase I
MLLTGSESPVVVVLSASMEPSFCRGDILFLTMGDAPVRTGEIVVWNADNKEIPVVHRVIQLHERRNSDYVDILTKVRSSSARVATQSDPLQFPIH